MDQPKTLILDIETAPLVALVWGLGQQFVSKEQILEDWFIMNFSAKWLGEPESSLIKMSTKGSNDKPLLKVLWKLFNEAEIVISQNGKKFDEPKVRARMMLNGFKPYKPFLHFDTFLNNRHSEFTSHSLDYLSDKFCKKYKKLKHKDFPGLSLWKECLGMEIRYRPNPKAWDEMRKYNDHDVLSTEELYINTRAWAPRTATPIYREGCSTCSKGPLQKRGIERLKAGSYQRLQCQNCGKWSRGAKV